MGGCVWGVCGCVLGCGCVCVSVCLCGWVGGWLWMVGGCAVTSCAEPKAGGKSKQQSSPHRFFFPPLPTLPPRHKPNRHPSSTTHTTLIAPPQPSLIFPLIAPPPPNNQTTGQLSTNRTPHQTIGQPSTNRPPLTTQLNTNGQPSTVIAYALSCNDYRSRFLQLRAQVGTTLGTRRAPFLRTKHGPRKESQLPLRRRIDVDQCQCHASGGGFDRLVD